MWLSASAIAWLFFPLPALTALLLGVIVAPTDPVLADSIVTGRIADESVPARMRDSITAESGSNDGLGLLFVLLPVSLMTRPAGEAITHWLATTLLWEIVVGLLIGAALGWLAGRCVDWAYDQPFTERVSVLGASVALALTVLATVRLVGADGLLAVFAAGVTFARFITRRENPHQHRVQEGIARFFDLPVFVLPGTVLPWGAWRELGWTGVAFAAAVLALRRPPAWLLLRPLLPSLRRTRDVLFNGWFGPIGIAALIYAARESRETGIEQVRVLASLVVLASIVVHGGTATPLTRPFGRLEARDRHGGERRPKQRAAGPPCSPAPHGRV